MVRGGPSGNKMVGVAGAVANVVGGGRISRPSQAPVGGIAQMVRPIGLMNASYVDTVSREIENAALDTWLQNTESLGVAGVGSVNVPQQARWLAGIIIGAAPDLSVAGSTSGAIAVRLSGSGLLGSGWRRFPGPGYAKNIDTSGGAGVTLENVHYPLQIPLEPGGEIVVETTQIGVDVGDVGASVILVFANAPHPEGFIDVDFREISIADDNVATALTEVASAAEGPFHLPNSAQFVDFGVMALPVYTAGAIVARCMPIFHVTGDGLASGGSHHILGDSHMETIVASGQAVGAFRPEFGDLNRGIRVVGGNTLQVDGIILHEDPGTAFAVAALCYRG